MDKWKEKFEALSAHPSPAIQHRAAYILRNFIVVGGKEIALDIVQTSKIVELLDYILHLPDITDSEPLNPEVIVLGQVCIPLGFIVPVILSGLVHFPVKAVHILSVYINPCTKVENQARV